MDLNRARNTHRKGNNTMNAYIQRTKDAILDYLGKAQQTGAKIEEGRKIYQPECMGREEKRLREELLKARKETEAKLDSIYQEASAGARDWAKLDGSKLTADASLLQGQGVTPEQFEELVARYQDNYTMLDALRKYGEARNQDAAKEARDSGENFPATLYNVHDIPGPDAKMKEWDDMRKQATYFLNVADGTGFNSDFERTFAASTADKHFEAWGKDQPEAEKRDPDAIQKAFTEAWGF